MKDKIIERVVQKFKQRSKVGIKKYNTTLDKNNSRDFLLDLQEELMDACNYIEKLMYDRDKEIKELKKVIYWLIESNHYDIKELEELLKLKNKKP